MIINEEKRSKFIECAGKRVNNVLHDIQILEPMARSSVYDFTKQDIEEMFSAMQETLDNARSEFEKKFEEKVKSEKKVFSFGQSAVVTTSPVENVPEVSAQMDTNEPIEVVPNVEVTEEIISEPSFADSMMS